MRRRTVATSSFILASNDPASYEYHPSVDLLPPDFDSVYRGHQGYLAFWRRWLDAFEDIRWDPEEILDFGANALVTTQQSAHGSGSGVAVSIPVFQLFTFRRGLVIRQEDFVDRAAALEAAALADQAGESPLPQGEAGGDQAIPPPNCEFGGLRAEAPKA